MTFRRIPLIIPLLLLLAACTTAQAAEAPTPTMNALESSGKFRFEATCSRCHSTIEDLVVVGPSLYGIGARAGERVAGLDAEAYIRQSILEPGAYEVEGFPSGTMPTTFGDELEPEQIDALAAYLLTLR